QSAQPTGQKTVDRLLPQPNNFVAEMYSTLAHAANVAEFAGELPSVRHGTEQHDDHAMDRYPIAEVQKCVIKQDPCRQVFVRTALKVDVHDTIGWIAMANGDVCGGSDGGQINVERRQRAKVAQAHLDFVVVQEVLHQVLQGCVEGQRHATIFRG